ncbi:MAG: aquaporin [Actinobacteria bacterium]|nr:aquaporin [Actinomycetota bacterium]
MGPRSAHSGLHLRIWAAEAAGTALMVLAVVLAAGLTLGESSPVAQALPGPGARFLALGAIIGPCIALITVSPLGRLSGAHINPALTLGFWVLGRVSGHDLAGYLGAQLAGGLAGALVAAALLPTAVADSIGGGVTHPTVSTTTAVAIEAAMTAILLLVVLGFLSRPRLARWTPLVLAPLLTVLVWLGSPPTGASLNPARSEGPALAFADTADLWIYLLGPLAGALAAALLWRTGLCGAGPVTAKLFHDPRYQCSLRSELPAMPCNA